MASLQVDRDVAVPMRDGTALLADVYRPSAPGRYPALLSRTPYSKAGGGGMFMNAVNAAFAGYAVVVQDVRGRLASQGDFVFFHNERDDGYDSVEWCAAQPWSNGRVGMFGGSYVGLTQWQAAIARPPSLRAIAPTITDSDYHDGWTYDGGAFQLGFNLSWTLLTFAMDAMMRPSMAEHGAGLASGLGRLVELARHRPLRDLPLLANNPAGRSYREWLDHPDDDAYWRSFSVQAHHGEIAVPALNIGGWHDLFTKGSPRNFIGMRANGATEEARRGARLIVGAWEHTSQWGARCGDRRLLNRAQLLVDPLHLRWFDYWLKEIDNGVGDEPPVQLFVIGPDEWRTYDDWPPPGTRFEPMFLRSSGRANTAAGDGALSHREPAAGEPPDRYAYDPNDPVPSIGGIWNLADGIAGGMFDQRPVEGRNDVLVYVSEPLTEPVEVIGPVSAVIWAETDAPDTDWTAKLVDVTPGGVAWNVCDGIIRARYRQSFERQQPITPGAPLEYTIDMRAVAYRFGAGHRIGLEVSSSNFPRFDANPNTGGVIATATETRPARQSIYHDAGHPSRVILPVQPPR